MTTYKMANFTLSILILICFLQNSALAQEPSKFITLSTSQQDETIKRLATDAINNYVSKTDSNGKTKPNDIYEVHRASANLTRALFFPKTESDTKKDGNKPDVLLGYSILRQRIAEEAKQSEPRKITEILSNFISKVYELYKIDNLAEKDDGWQESFFRLQISYAAFQDAMREYKSEYDKFQESANVWKEVIRDSKFELEVEKRIAEMIVQRAESEKWTQEKFDTEIKKLEKFMGDFVIVFNAIIDRNIPALLSPIDKKTGQSKSPDRLELGKKRAKYLQEVKANLSLVSIEELAKRIYEATKDNSSADLQRIIFTYFLDEMKKREATLPQEQKK